MQRYIPYPGGMNLADERGETRETYVLYSDAHSRIASLESALRDTSDALEDCIAELHELNGDSMGYEGEQKLISEARAALKEQR